jgi:maltose alpha-D-glucosyltransferase/alpha-amylase
MLQQFVPSQGDGWTFALEGLKTYFGALGRRRWPEPELPATSAVLNLVGHEPPEDFAAAAGELPAAIRVLGRRTAECHLALVGARRVRDFAPQPLTAADLEGMTESFRRQAQQSLELLYTQLNSLPEEHRDLADRVLGYGSLLDERFQVLQELKTSLTRIRIHGDYHLGQVLRTDDDWVLLDFEGEPLKPLTERREKMSPLKDVAGMLRSFDYAAQTALRRLAEEKPDKAAAAAPWARLWERWLGATFLDGYLVAAESASFLPADRADLRVLLDAFLLDKSLYELSYELNNRPAWVGVPLSGVVEIAERFGLTGPGSGS